MKAVFTFHEIVRGTDRHPPSSVILDLTEIEYDELTALGAVRDASDDEIALASPVEAADAVVEPVKQDAPPVQDELPVDKKSELLARAAELGLTVRKNASEETLLAAIHEAEAEAAKAEGTADADVTDPELLT